MPGGNVTFHCDFFKPSLDPPNFSLDITLKRIFISDLDPTRSRSKIIWTDPDLQHRLTLLTRVHTGSRYACKATANRGTNVQIVHTCNCSLPCSLYKYQHVFCPSLFFRLCTQAVFYRFSSDPPLPIGCSLRGFKMAYLQEKTTVNLV